MAIPASAASATITSKDQRPAFPIIVSSAWTSSSGSSGGGVAGLFIGSLGRESG